MAIIEPMPGSGENPRMPARPLLRWAGSKRQLVGELRKHYPAGAKYIEPFAGSACLFFSINPPKAILGDINVHLIATYGAVRDCPIEVSRFLAEMPQDEASFYRIRRKFATISDAARRAAAFIYLNRFCFNGLYRTNMAGQFNVPYGGGKTGRVPNLEEISAVSERIKTTKLVTGDFEVVLRRARESDFVYMDPPYQVAARRVFREYDRQSFAASDLSRLRLALEDLDRRGVSFLVSYAKCDEAQELSAGYYCRTVNVRRNISGFHERRGTTPEVFIFNKVLPHEHS